MGKLRALLVIIAFFVVAFAVGQRWKLKPETAANRAVQRGEIAVLVNSDNARSGSVRARKTPTPCRRR